MRTRRAFENVTTNCRKDSNSLPKRKKKRDQTNSKTLISSLKPNTEQNINNIEQKKLTRQAVKQDAALKNANSNKETNILPKVKKKPDKTNPSTNHSFKENIILANVVMTPLRLNNLNKLSLTKCSTAQKTTSTYSPKALDISQFSPIRNSTVFELGEKLCEEELGSSETSAKRNSSNSKGSRVLKNLTNNPELIEQIITAERQSDDELEIINTEEKHGTTEKDAPKHENKSHKFFHRSPVRKTQSRKTAKEPEKVFEFLSQSDTSECEAAKNKDPAADIIQKLISEGKVCVASTHKGTGRPFMKRLRKKTGKKKKIITKQKATKVKRKEIINKVNNIKESADELPNDFMCDASLTPVHNHDFDAQDIPEIDEPSNEGGFSRLARSVLLQQTKNTHKKDLTEQRRLLAIARNFVSTPAANCQNQHISTSDLSPIQSLNLQRRPVCPSPWRIDDDSHLPRVFNFSKNTSCMPTFSSDYIPPTPKKNKQLNNNTQISNDSNAIFNKPTRIEQDNSFTIPTNLTNTNSNDQLIKSLGSEQDSNAENMPPPTLDPVPAISNSDENAEIFNLRQQPNPRRTLRNRSPLKAINILEVVSLPPWKKPEATDTRKDLRSSTAASENSKDEKSNGADDLFGFEEFLDANSEAEEEEPTSATSKKAPNRPSIKRNLRKKLKDLQKWRPKDTNQGKSDGTLRSCRLFGEGDRPKQRLIKEMLCSTMINREQAEIGNDGSDEECNDEAENNAKANDTDFFNDYEPETTLDKKQTQRTYGRPAKRKRKTRNNFVMFPDSEESNSDSENEEHGQKKKAQKKRRHEAQADAKENPVLKSFINEFNSMCKEVENYELHVE
ncbi:unnamed protein product [Ceratitis capitata]|uniref:(Mediterranean fruit fly) hypothetical protein n=1 Tax=Ceratitis capitata TaxID=7213 RepID=A0A811U9U3_CERCA|nr:unnamed protein product [Ceratitis capitata]